VNDRQRIREMLLHVLRCLLSQRLLFVSHRDRAALIGTVNPLTEGDKVPSPLGGSTEALYAAVGVCSQ
jgi:hypothetical protein